MLSTILIYLLITNGIEMQAVKNKRCLRFDSICSKNYECCHNKCSQAAGRRFSTCESKKSIQFEEKPGYDLLSIDYPTYCFPGKHYCLEDDDCCSRKCISVGLPPSYLLTAHYCSG